MQPLVITVHGINSDGEWQNAVEKVLAPHCKCRHFRYRDYRYFGFALQLIGPVCGLLAAGCVGVSLGQLIDAPLEPASLAVALESALRHLGTPELPAKYAAASLMVVGLSFIGLLLIRTSSQIAARSVDVPISDRNVGKLSIFGVPLVATALFAESAWFWALPLAAVSMLLVSFEQRPAWLLSMPALLLAGCWLTDTGPLWHWVSLGVMVVAGLIIYLNVWRSAGNLRAVWLNFATLAKTWLVPVGMLLISGWLGIMAGAGLHTAQAALVDTPFRTVNAPAIWLLLAAALALLGVIEAIWRRRGCVDRFRRQVTKWIDEYDSIAPTVHIIAHSFGTFLTGEFLRLNDSQKRDANETPLKIDRVILVGSVLPSAYPWHQVIGESSGGHCGHVRNEVGERDWVVWLAGLTEHRLRPLLWLRVGWPALCWLRFGDAGRRGFMGRPELIHDVKNPYDDCESCCTREERLKHRVHNVRLPTFLHSDAFVAIERASIVWLPFILGLDPWGFWDFRRLCSQAAKYEQNRQNIQHRLDQLNNQLKKWRQDSVLAADEPSRKAAQDTLDGTVQEINAATNELTLVLNRITSIERQLGERVWDWTHNPAQGRETLRDYITDQIRYRIVEKDHRETEVEKKATEARQRAEAEYTDGTIKQTWEAVGQGMAALAALQTTPQPDSARIRLLSPQAAVEKALEALPEEAFT